MRKLPLPLPCRGAYLPHLGLACHLRLSQRSLQLCALLATRLFLLPSPGRLSRHCLGRPGALGGDRLLGRVSERLAELITENELIGRLGGDEFAVVMNDATDASRVSIRAGGRPRLRVDASRRSGHLLLSASDCNDRPLRLHLAPTRQRPTRFPPQLRASYQYRTASTSSSIIGTLPTAPASYQYCTASTSSSTIGGGIIIAPTLLVITAVLTVGRPYSCTGKAVLS